MENVLEMWRPKPTDDLALKPCPFCGNEDVIYMKYEHAAGGETNHRWMVFCGGCTASVDPGWAQDRSIVRDLWNRRTNT